MSERRRRAPPGMTEYAARELNERRRREVIGRALAQWRVPPKPLKEIENG